MAEAKNLAKEQYAHLQVQRQIGKVDKPCARRQRRRRDTMSKRELSSLKSAEICREKFTIYETLLEQAVMNEEEKNMNILGKMFDMNAANLELEHRIAELQRKKDMMKMKMEMMKTSSNIDSSCMEFGSKRAVVREDGQERFDPSGQRKGLDGLEEMLLLGRIEDGPMMMRRDDMTMKPDVSNFWLPLP